MPDADVDERIDALFEEGRDLDDASRKTIVELGEEAVPRLVEIIEDRDYWDENAPGDGWAPIHAARILADLGDPRSIEPMYAALEEADPDAILDTELTRALANFGSKAVEPGLERLQSSGESFRDDLACVFARLDDDREVVFQVLIKNLVDNPLLGAANLSRYGDERALDALHPMLNRLLRAAPEQPQLVREARAVAEAIEDLGGELTDNQQDQLEVFGAEGEEYQRPSEKIIDRIKRGEADHDHPDTYVNDHDIGRNDPCWCGSGRKYKHCHWREDQEA